MNNFFSFFQKGTYHSPTEAYNLWAENYDDEYDNLMLTYDKIILNELLSKIKLTGKVILDYGCGTGRNWPLLMENNPEAIIGCDISIKMLEKLKSKYETGMVYLVKNNKLPFINDNKCDVIISTLVAAHVEKIEEMLSEWNRIIKKSGEIIITDFHPTLLAKGGRRTFTYNNKTITIKNYIHPIKKIEKSLSSYGFKSVRRIEKKIDEEVKQFYIKKTALNVYERFKTIPFIYGIHFSRHYGFE